MRFARRGILLGILLLVLVVILVCACWYFYLSSRFVSASYENCVKVSDNKNQLVCVYYPKTYAEQKFCESKSGIYNQFGNCGITYYNPSFKMPKNFEECKRILGPLPNNVNCDLEILVRGSYDQNITKKLIFDCFNGNQKEIDYGMKMSGGCIKRFTNTVSQ